MPHILRCILCSLNVWSHNRPSNHCIGITDLRAHELVPTLAEKFGVPLEMASRIDRGLAEAGLRAKGKGRNLPDVTRQEALIFMFACMAVEKVTKAAEETTPWLAMIGRMGPLPEPDYEEGWGVEEEEENKQVVFYKAMQPFVDRHNKSGGFFTLLDFVHEVCRVIESGKLDPHDVEVSISFTDLLALVTCTDEFNQRYAFIHFSERGDAAVPDGFDGDPMTRIDRKRSVTGFALKEIIDRT